MKIKKTVTEKVILANRENGKKGPGPNTQRGKDVASQNATEHGILARNLRFKDDQEKAEYNALISDLRRRIDWNDPFQRILAEEFAIAHVRRGRALKLEQRMYRQQNPATELVLNTMGNSKLADAGVSFVDPESAWECLELTMASTKVDDRGEGRYSQLHAKFQDPMDKALRYQRATARDFYRALNELCMLRREEKPNSK